MSDDHHDEGGGHEVDKMPHARLFNLLVGLSALTLLSCIGVIQIFNMQVRWIEENRETDQDGGRFTAFGNYQSESEAIAAGYGKFEFEVEGKAETRFFTPLSAAKKAVIDDPKLLGGTKAYKGWETSAVGKQIKDWGGMPKPEADAKKPPAGGKVPAGKVPAGKGAPTIRRAPAGKGGADGEADAKAGDAKGGKDTKGSKAGAGGRGGAKAGKAAGGQRGGKSAGDAKKDKKDKKAG